MNKNNYLNLIVAVTVLLTTNCTGTKNPEKFEKLWETDGFDTPECVIYDNENNVYYVSNIGGKEPLGKDGNGFISILNPDGSINKLKFVEGLNAPKGMGIYKGELLVTDIDKVVKIDLATGKITDEIPIEGAQFLNDIAIDKNGVAYITDSQSKKYIQLSDTTYKTLVIDTVFKFPNGIIYDKDRLVSGVGNEVITINPETGAWKSLISETGSVDGLAKVDEETFIISDWQGRIHLIYLSKEKELLLDTTANEGENAADFYFNSKENLVLVPTFFKNTIACYRLNR